MRYSVRNLVAQRDADALADRLRSEGFAMRDVDVSDVGGARDLWARLGDAFDFDEVSGWDSLEDHLATALLPDDDEGDDVAFVLGHGDHLLRADLDAFLELIDILVSTSRQAATMGTNVISFILGDGDGFPPLPPA